MIRAILTDIEGTTSSDRHVKTGMYAYAKAHLPAYIAAHRADPEVTQLLEDTRRIGGLPADADDAALFAQLMRWQDADLKVTPLKAFHGLIWHQGYEHGAFQGHVYEEVPETLQRWREQGLGIYVFSSGSVFAQTQFYRFSPYGDLRPLFDGHFDRAIGAKRETQAYERIAAAIGLPPPQILFLSDVAEELDAARAVGYRTCGLDRGEAPPPQGHRLVQRFDQIDPTAAA